MIDFLTAVLHTVFVIVINIIGWGMLVAGVIGFIRICWAIISGENCGKLPWL